MEKTLNYSVFADKDVDSLKKSSNTQSRYCKLMQDFDVKPSNQNWVEINTDKYFNDTTYNFVDLFAGGGGFSKGVVSANFNKLFSVEIDKDASNTLRNNFPNSFHHEGAIENLTTEKINSYIQNKKVHVLFGGPPCQGFSVAGLRNSNDPRNKLWKEYIRIVEYIQPDYIVMENVPGILTMQNGEVYKEILKQLSDIGYPNTSVRILEVAKYNVPQLRSRAIFVGNRLNKKNPYPKPILNECNYLSIDSAISDLIDVPFNSTWNHEGTKHSKEMVSRLSRIKPGGSLYESFRDSWKRQRSGVPCMTIKENHGGVHVHYKLNRVLTAREMARLQTFPDDYIFSGTFKRAYWQIGNAVPCEFAKHIALSIAYNIKS
jgi:DNA (cytosine-5)-methyltransferase 1